MPIAAAALAERGKREGTMLLTASTSEDYASATTREKKSTTDTDIETARDTDTARGTDTDTARGAHTDTAHIHTQLQHCMCVRTRHVSLLLMLPHESMAAN